MSDPHPREDGNSDVGGEGEEVPPPVGTLFLLMLFLMLMAGMWVAIYVDFLGR